MGENYYGITDPGRQRTNNEDSFIAETVPGRPLIIGCVIDGVGGYAGGEIAARLTRDEIIKNLEKLPAAYTNHLVATLEKANERIVLEKSVNHQNEKMACVVTLSLVDIENNIFYFAHVGDTRLYLFRDGSLIKITKDHSTVGFLEESGRLTEEAAMLHPRRNEVNKALGYETELSLRKDFIDTGESPFLPGDAILLCSDGLTDMISSGQIIAILNTDTSLSEKCRQLVDAANEAGGKDNITAVLVQNDKKPQQHAATKPVAALRKQATNGDGELKLTGAVNPAYSAAVKQGQTPGINKVLLIVTILSLAAIAWLLFNRPSSPGPVQAIAALPVIAQKNKDEINLADSINQSSTGEIRLAAGQQMILTDTLLIARDTVHIIGNGATLLSDSSYRGPAFRLATTCRYVLLDSLTLENFNIGISVLNKGLHLKNVRFKNCRLPMLFEQQLIKDTLVSGKQAEPFFYFADTMHRSSH